jgi:hypothetical protein
MDLLDRRLTAFASRARWQQRFDTLLPAWTVALLIAAVGLAGLRMLEWPALISSLLTAAFLFPLLRLFRLPPAETDAAVAACLDRACQARGLVMGLAMQAAEHRDPAWLERVRRALEDATLPAWCWQAGKQPLLALLCLLLVGLMPLPKAPDLTRPPPQPTRVLEPLRDQEQALAEADLLPEQTQAEIRQQLDELDQRLQQTGLDAQAWLAIDRLQQQLERQGLAAAMHLAEATAAAQQLATPQSTMARLPELAQALANLARQTPGLLPQADQLEPELLELLQERADQQALRDCLNGLCQGDAEELRALGAKLAKQLAERRANLKAIGADKACLAFLQDLGYGVKRGPSHVPLQGAIGSEAGEVGELQDLPPGAILNPDGSVTLALQHRDPDMPEDEPGPLQRGQQQDFAASQAAANTARSAPRHRAAVTRFMAAAEPAPKPKPRPPPVDLP